MRIHPFRAVYPNLELIASADSFFGTVKYDYREFERSGFFTKTKSKALYVYRITGPSRIHLGVIASVDIDDYIEGKIIKHEDTLSTKEQDMMNLLLNRKAMIKPVLLTYKSNPEIERILSEVIQRQPLYNIHFDESNEDHQIWKIKEEREVEALRRAFAHVKKVYIADGHHRCSTSAILHNGQDVNNLDLDFSKLLCAFMSFDQLDIHDYNRGVEILNEISPATLVAILSKYCRIKRMKGPFRPSRKHEVSMLLDKEWFRLRWRSSVMRLYDNEDIILDSMIVTDIIMKKIFKIRDVRSDKRIKYIEGTLGTFGLTQLCTKRPDCVGFGLYPVSMHEFKEISDKGQMLPPKSTWFEPRMKNGFLSQEF